MYPKTLYGWYNMLIRGYPYNAKTAPFLDHIFKPNPRLLSTLEERPTVDESVEPKRIRPFRRR